MSIDIIQQRLKQYDCKTKLDEQNALKEITQEIALLALSKAHFFKEAEFHGGTALRVLYNLQRFSEDLDFALIKPNPNFQLSQYLQHMTNEFQAFGYEIEISDRKEVHKTVQKQFIKVDSIGKLLNLQYPLNRADRSIRIKFEIDTNPPLGAETEIKFLTFPLPFSILAKDLPSSFAGKLHALLCRQYDKGRDWYDFIWYITYKTPINLPLLSHALKQQGPWQGENISVNHNWIISALKNKIETLNWAAVKQDVTPLLKPNDIESLRLWGIDFFLAQLDTLNQYLTK